MTRIYERKVMPYAEKHLIEELSYLVDRCRYEMDTNKAGIYMHAITYHALRNQVEETGKIYGAIHCDINPINRSYGDFWGIPIRLDNKLEPFRFIIREEDNMAKNDDSLDAFTYSVKCYGGLSYGKSNKVLTPLPTRFIINDGATILFWSDGTKTIVKRSKDDNNDIVKSFLWAYFQKHSGLSKTKANKYLRDLDKED